MKNIPLRNILFLDIETVPQEASWENLDPDTQCLWTKKTAPQRRDDILPEDFYTERGGIMAEFGKIVCISVGMAPNDRQLKIKSFAGDDEAKLLREFGELFNRLPAQQAVLCAHNGKEFDFPWIARRFLVNGMEPPAPFRLFGKKPWEIPHLDTMELWKFGDYKTYVSLELLAHIFGVPTPKDDIDGSMVAEVYHRQRDLPRIVEYCEKDVLTLANVFRKMRQEDLLTRLPD